MTTTKPESVYCGLDLHSSNTMAAIIDAEGNRLVHSKRPNRIEDLLSFLQPYRERLAGIGVESTYNWYWLVDGLAEADLPVVLGHPAAMKPYSGLKHSNDKTDAYWLADLMRLGLFPKAYVYPKEIRPLRDLLRRRMLLVQNRTSLLVSFSSMHARQNGTTPKRRDFLAWDEEDLASAFSDPMSGLAAKALLNSVQHLNQEILLLEKAARKESKDNELRRRAQKMPGIAHTLGMVIALETGTLERFPSAEHYASYCRTVPGHRSSNNKKKGEGNTRNGNKYLAWAWIEAAQFARRFNLKARAWFDRKAAATNKIVASKALACKMCKAGYYVMRDDADFDENRAF
jgi:transposase